MRTRKREGDCGVSAAGKPEASCPVRAGGCGWSKRWAVIVVSACVPAILPWVGASARPGCPVTKEKVKAGVWKTIPIPEFPRKPHPEGFRTDTTRPTFALDRRRPKRLFVSDGWTVFRTVDGGCSWAQVFSATDAPTSQPRFVTVSVRRIVVPSIGPAGRVYMLLERDGLPQLARSDDGAETWSVAPLRLKAGSEQPGAIVAGEPEQLWVAPSDPRVLYATVRSTFRSPDSILLRSYDAGATWEVSAVYSVASEYGWRLTSFTGSTDTSCSLGADRCTGVPFRTLAVDPLEPEVLWTSGENGIYRSEDAGVTWDKAANIDWQAISDVWDIDIWHPRGRPARIAALGRRFIAWSEDGGTSWQRVKVPDKREFAANGSGSFAAEKDGYVAEMEPNDTLMQQRQHVFWLRKGAWVRITPKGLQSEEYGSSCYPWCELSLTDASTRGTPQYFFLKFAWPQHPEAILVFIPDRGRRGGRDG